MTGHCFILKDEAKDIVGGDDVNMFAAVSQTEQVSFAARKRITREKRAHAV